MVYAKQTLTPLRWFPTIGSRWQISIKASGTLQSERYEPHYRVRLVLKQPAISALQNISLLYL